MAAAANHIASGSTTAVNASPPHQVLLLDLLKEDPDLELKFEDGTALVAHTVLLSMASGVLKTAIQAERGACSAALPTTIAASTSRPAIFSITLEGTSKEEWLEAMEFVYPVSPPPIISFDNLELLFVLGSKYDMPCLLTHAGQFLTQNTKQLVHSPADSPLLVWKWLKLADHAGVSDACKACVTKLLEVPVKGLSVDAEELQGFSPLTLKWLVAEMGKLVTGLGPGTAFCSWCKKITSMTVSCPGGIYKKPRCASCTRELI